MATLQSKLILSLVDRVTAPARKVEQRMRALNDRIEKNNRQVAAATGKFAAAAAGAAAFGAALTAPARAAGNFESAMADIRKVVDFPTPESFQKMRSDILELSKVLPLSVEGLAAIATSAGQAGIAREDIIAFTESAAKIGVAFDIGAAQAGDAMKALMTGLGLNVEGVTLLFDKMNVLSDNQAATAADITSVVTKVGATAKGFGFAAGETAAFGSAMLAAGGKVDTTATSIRNMGKALTMGTSATGRQKDAFAKLGLDAADVAKRMQEDAAGTTLAVLERINSLPKEVQSSVQFDLFGAEARELSKVRQNLDIVREGLRLTGDDAAAAGSAQREFEVRSDTLQAKTQLLQNSFERLNIAIGDTFMKSLKNVMERIGRIADAVARWAEENPTLASGLIKATGGLVAFNLAFAGVNLARLLLWGGALRTAATGLRAVGAASAFVKGSAGSALALDAALAAMEGRKPGRIRKIGVALSALAGATGLGKVARWLRRIADITGLTAVGRGIRTVARATGLIKVPKGIGVLARGLVKIGGVVARLTGLRLVAAGLSAVVGVIGGISAPLWVPIAAAIAAVGAAWKWWDRVTAIVSGVASAIGEELQPVIEWIRNKLEPLRPIIEPIGQAFTVLGEGISSAFAAIRDFFTGDIFKREKLGEKEFASIEARSKETAAAIIDSVKQAFIDFIDWVAGIPGRIVEALGTLSLGTFIDWPEPPRWLRWLMGEDVGATRPAPVDFADQAAERGQTPVQHAAEIIDMTDLPSAREVGAMRDEAAGLRAEIAAIQKEIDAVQPGRGGDAKIAALKQQMAPLKARLGEIEGQIAAVVREAQTLRAAVQVLDEANVSPEINDASIRRALGQVERLRDALKDINGAAPGTTDSPVDGARAKGGPMRRGDTYLVGEEGTETVTPQRSGFVHTARETVRMRERVVRQTERLRDRLQTAGAVARAAAVAPVAAGISTLPASAAPPQFPVPAAVTAGASALPAVQSVAAIRPAPSPVAAQAAPVNAGPDNARTGVPGGGPVTINVGGVTVQGGANASAEEIGEEFGRQITARLRSQFSDEF